MSLGYDYVQDIADCTYAVANNGILTAINDAVSNPCDEFMPKKSVCDVKNVIFNPPVTVVLWTDGTKTISRCSEDDSYEERTGFLVCVAKKFFGNGTRYRKVMKKFDIPDYGLVDIIRHQLDPNVHTTFIEEE